MLDIIVTHYKEPWEIGKPFFDMLACQRFISFDSFRVILVHDGTGVFGNKVFEPYPYRVDQYNIEHGGVSAARNYGLEKAEAEWVEFCDFDDCYSSVYSLYIVMSHMDNDVDYMWTPFYMEVEKDGEYQVQVKDKENIVWIHGKYFRRDWLNRNKIRFPVGIHYSEDSAFCAIVNELAQGGRRGKIRAEFPVYTWTIRKNSVTTDPANTERNLTGFIDRNTWVVEEYKRRGIPHILMVGRMFADAYWAFHRKGKYFPEQEQRFVEIGKKYVRDFKQNSADDMTKILIAASKAFKPEELENAESFPEWYKRLWG